MFLLVKMSATTVRLPPSMAREVEQYRDAVGLEKTAIAARRLIRLGLEAEKKAAEVSRT